MFHFLIKPNVV